MEQKKVQMSLSPVMSLVCINEISVYNDSVSNRPVRFRKFYLEAVLIIYQRIRSCNGCKLQTT